MYDISINLYKTFCVVAQSKNYVDASNKLHISTTAISKNIRQLESLLGIFDLIHAKLLLSFL